MVVESGCSRRPAHRLYRARAVQEGCNRATLRLQYSNTAILRTANGENSFAELLANHIDRPVTGSQSGNSFSGVKNGKPGQGLPGNGSRVPGNYKKPVYLVPEGKGWKTYDK